MDTLFAVLSLNAAQPQKIVNFLAANIGLTCSVGAHFVHFKKKIKLFCTDEKIQTW